MIDILTRLSAIESQTATVSEGMQDSVESLTSEIKSLITRVGSTDMFKSRNEVLMFAKPRAEKLAGNFGIDPASPAFISAWDAATAEEGYPEVSADHFASESSEDRPGYETYEILKDKISEVLIKMYGKYNSYGEIIQAAQPAAVEVAKNMGIDPNGNLFKTAWNSVIHDPETQDAAEAEGNDDDYTDYLMQQGELGSPDRMHESIEDIAKLAGVKSAIAECGMAGASSPASINISAGSGAEVSAMIKDLMGLSGVRPVTPNDMPVDKGHTAIVSAPANVPSGMPDMKALISAIDDVEGDSHDSMNDPESGFPTGTEDSNEEENESFDAGKTENRPWDSSPREANGQDGVRKFGDLNSGDHRERQKGLPVAKPSDQMESLINSLYADYQNFVTEAAKPSAGLSTAEKSAVVKKAKAGKDIGKPGEGFEKVEKAAKKSGATDPKAVAAAAMWKGQAAKKKVSEMNSGAKARNISEEIDTVDSEVRGHVHDTFVHPKHGKVFWVNHQGQHAIVSVSPTGNKITHVVGDESTVGHAWNHVKKSIGVSEVRRPVSPGQKPYNFDGADLEQLTKIRDLDLLKQKAIALISTQSDRPMKPEKVEWFANAINRAPDGVTIIKLMYDLLLSGEGLGAIGASKGYRAKFK